MSECVFRWTAAYYLKETQNCVLRVRLRIRLQPDPHISTAELEAAKAKWRTATIQAWSSGSAIERRSGTCRCSEYGVDADVKWVSRAPHHVVLVHSGVGRPDMGNFFLEMPAEVVAHEVGHMLGYPDEYEDDRCPDRLVTSDNSIMQTPNGQPRPRHYSRLATWLSARTGCDYKVLGL